MIEQVDGKDFDISIMESKLEGTECIHCLGKWSANIPISFVELNTEGLIWWHQHGMCRRRIGRLYTYKRNQGRKVVIIS